MFFLILACISFNSSKQFETAHEENFVKFNFTNPSPVTNLHWCADSKIEDKIEFAFKEWSETTGFDFKAVNDCDFTNFKFVCTDEMNNNHQDHWQLMQWNGAGVWIKKDYCDSNFGIAGARHAVGHALGFEDYYEWTSSMHSATITVEARTGNYYLLTDSEIYARQMWKYTYLNN